MNAPSNSLLLELKKQELIAKDKQRAENLLLAIQESLRTKSEVTRVSSTKNSVIS